MEEFSHPPLVRPERARERRRDAHAIGEYLESLNHIHPPFETAEEEARCAQSARDGNADAQREFIERNLRLVINVAKEFLGRGLNLDDLVQYGNLGLLRAIKKFEPARGYRFSTYGVPWIKQAIRRGVLANSRIIAIPERKYHEMGLVKSARRDFYHEHGRNPSIDELAQQTGIEGERLRLLVDLLERKVGSLDAETLSPHGEEVHSLEIADSHARGGLESLLTVEARELLIRELVEFRAQAIALGRRSEDATSTRLFLNSYGLIDNSCDLIGQSDLAQKENVTRQAIGVRMKKFWKKFSWYAHGAYGSRPEDWLLPRLEVVSDQAIELPSLAPEEKLFISGGPAHPLPEGGSSS